MTPDKSDAEYRAILTPREREIITGEADVSDGYYYRVVSRIRDKIDQLNEDLAVLEENHPTLGDELRETVCDEETTHV
jgi:hypothetical protein